MGKQQNKYWYFSIAAHVVILLVLILGLDTTGQMVVFENTNKQDVISAVVLGDTAKSKILPQKITQPPPTVQPPKPLPKPIPEVAQKSAPPPPVKSDAIPLKTEDKQKKLAEKKAAEEEKKRLHDLLAKDFLADLNKEKAKQKKIKQKELQSKFQKTLKEQAEKSLRNQLLNEEIKLKGAESRQAQGEVNKYKALIIQAISEHWIIPTQANKKLYCELMIRIAPGGVVLDVQITKSSGDPSLDSSARAAVLKASPLPVPSDVDAFEAFRQFVLKVKPENILAGDI